MDWLGFLELTITDQSNVADNGDPLTVQCVGLAAYLERDPGPDAGRHTGLDRFRIAYCLQQAADAKSLGFSQDERRVAGAASAHVIADVQEHDRTSRSAQGMLERLARRVRRSIGKVGPAGPGALGHPA